MLGWCDARAGQPGLAVDAMRAARVRDPHNWQYAYGLAIAQALAGEDPRPSAALALRLNPLEPLARKLVRDMRSKSAKRRRTLAGRAADPVRLTKRGGPKPASRRTNGRGALSAARRCDAGARGPR